MYLSATAVLTLMLLAWHFSIQAAAHDAAIFQVRTWLQSMGATAGQVQFRLLRGALTIENINANMHGQPLQIQSILMKGNPASITGDKPLLQQIKITGVRYESQQEAEQWLLHPPQMPPSFARLFRHAKHILITSAEVKNLSQHTHISINQLQVSGAPEKREIFGEGTFQRGEEDAGGSWFMESFIPKNIGLQTGKISAQSPDLTAHMQWSGAWATQNLRFNVQAKDLSQKADMSARFQQQEQQWVGDIETNAWVIQNAQLQSSVTGKLSFVGTPQTWVLNSDKLIWKETVFSEHNIHIEQMTSYDLRINQPQKKVTMKRLDFADASIMINPKQAFISPTWQWDIDSMNVQALYITYGEQDSMLTLPPMNGTASLSQNTLTMDISQLVNDTEFWRIRSQKDNTFHVYTNHIPLVQLRSLLPEPIRSQSFDIQGKTSFALHIAPQQQWKTSGNIKVKGLAFASKKQKFSAKILTLNIKNAAKTGITSSTITANDWVAQFPLTPRQAWSNESHLDTWADIPWAFDSVFLKQGKVVIGTDAHVWLNDVDVSISDWRTKNTASINIAANMGFAPFTADLTLEKQEDQSMPWRNIKLNVEHANMFFLEEWLRISGLPYVGKGHFSLSLKAQGDNETIRGDVDLKFHDLQLLADENTTYLQQTLQVQSLEDMEQYKHLRTTFEGTHDWSILAGKALLAAAKASETSQSSALSTSKVVTEYHLGSLRIQQDMRLSLNERTRLRKLIKSIRKQKYSRIYLVPDIGTSPLTESFRQRITQTQAVIQSFMSKRGISRQKIYLTLPQEIHQSTSDIAAIHISVVK